MKPDGVRILNATNTQARNLVILSKILSLINRQILPLKLLRSQAIEWSKAISKEEATYKLSTGKLTEIAVNGKEKETGAFPHYLDLLGNIGLITKMNEFVRCNRLGLLFNLLKSKTENNRTATLSKSEQLFFFYILNSKDADALISILEIITQKDGMAKEIDVRRMYRDHLKSRFKAKAIASKGKVRFESEAVFRNLERTSEAMLLSEDNERNKEERKHFTSKHQVPNRLSWLTGLGLVSKSGNYFFLTNPGKNLLSSLECIDESQYKDLNLAWLYNKSWNILIEEGLGELADDELRENTGKCLLQYFDFFGDDGAFRISLHPAFLFTVISIACKYRAIVDYERFISILEPGLKINGRTFAVRVSPRLSESYINISFDR